MLIKNFINQAYRMGYTTETYGNSVKVYDEFEGVKSNVAIIYADHQLLEISTDYFGFVEICYELANTLPKDRIEQTTEDENIEALIEHVQKWAIDRKINQVSPDKQFLKLSEEVGELAGALARKDEAVGIDSMGDITVVLIILCEIMHWDYRDCLNTAWQVIKNRQGKTINGIFVKEADLNGE